MSETGAIIFLAGLALYALIGIGVALIYIAGGVGLIDPAAKGRGMRFATRLVITPGIIGLWPLMLHKLWRQRTPPAS